MTQQHIVSRRAVLASGAGVAAAGLVASAGPAGASVRTSAQMSQALTPEQLAGQRTIFSYPGLTPPSDLLQLISEGMVAGVIFFGENISSEAQIASVVAQLNAANAQSPVQAPLLLMTDQEGGEVARLPGAPALSEKQVGESADPRAAAAQAGTGAGQNMAGVGMNVNLAPVLGVYRQAGDFLDQFQRSYSMDPRVVTECGKAFIRAQQATGVAATAKHFPGLGAATASQNTDLGPVTLDLPLSTLRSVDERPYPQAIAAGVELIMVNWAIYPAFDPDYAAALSPVVVRGELRRRLGFRGVTITDAVEAGAAAPFGSYGQIAVLAAQAGMDLLLASNRDVTEGQAVVSGLAAALGDGTLPQAGFTAAARRVTALRLSLA